LPGNGQACQFAKEVNMKKVVIVLVVLAFVFLAAGCGNHEPSSRKTVDLTVLHAGSLTIPMRECEAEFNKLHDSNIHFLDQSDGSIKVVKSVSELHKNVDVVGVADYRLIPQFLIPKFAKWVIQFATNKLVIVYTDKSKYADEINADNWYKILQRKGVEFAYSDPNSDPCGYRTLLMFKLAEIYYKAPDLYKNLLKSVSPNNIKPKSVQLIAGLESGELDYAFEYLSVAKQNHLKYVELPNALNFSDPSLKDFYAKAKLTLNNGKVVVGAPIIYGITVPDNAPNKKIAEDFVAFLLSSEGRKIFEENGQPFIKFVSNIPVSELPEPIKNAIQSK
jgi:molybdate/tungstate transport system substrate-binding protein